jgi:AraC family transcriptional regulator, transcriptional activator of pobA
MTDQIKKIKFKSGIDLQIEILSLDKLTTTNKNLLVAPHRAEFYHIFLFEECSPTHLVDFNPIKIQPYTLLFIAKDRVHQFDQLLKYKGKVLIFTDDFFCSSENKTKFLRSTILFNDITDKPGIHLNKSELSRFLGICNSINEELSLPTDKATHDILKNYLYNFLLFADREKRKQGFSEIKQSADLDFTILFKDLLEKHFASSKNVSSYADKLHISEKRLRQATTNVLGKTPKEFIDDRIVLEAKRLLVHGNQSVKEIGFQLGFEEPTNFIKYFRKHTYKTPVEFRESYL